MKKGSKRQRIAGTTTELIEKLLAQEIRQERNVLLQCIRYIFNHKETFGIEEIKTTSSSSQKEQKNFDS